MARPRKRRSALRVHMDGVFRHATAIFLSPRATLSRGEKIGALGGVLLLLGVASLAFRLWPGEEASTRSIWSPGGFDAVTRETVDVTVPVREEPRRFPARTHMPPRREEMVSGAPDGRFYARTDLIRIDDPRVWWESDNDKHDHEDDHLFHRSMEAPMRRLIELVTQAGGMLKVQDSYRAEGIHAPRSLHRDGRAVDVTCDDLGLERLAKLAWAAGFDWVYHEVPRNGGAHVHASVRWDHPRMMAERSAAEMVD